MKIETMQDLVNELNNAIKMLGYCACETIGAVARDLNSTCQQCGGNDAYKSSPLQQVVKALQSKALVPEEHTPESLISWIKTTKISHEAARSSVIRMLENRLQASQEKDNET